MLSDPEDQTSDVFSCNKDCFGADAWMNLQLPVAVAPVNRFLGGFLFHRR